MNGNGKELGEDTAASQACRSGVRAEDLGAEDMVLRVCECGSVGRTPVGGGGLTRCGRDGTRNMRWTCPVTTYRVVAWEEVT